MRSCKPHWAGGTSSSESSTRPSTSLRRYLEMSPDRWAYQVLAGAFKQAGKFDKWQEILDESLKQEDTGLDHAQVVVEIARHFMSRKEWDKAWPYVDAAAQTYAGWAMLCAADCYEGLQEWDKSEQWVRRASELRRRPNGVVLLVQAHGQGGPQGGSSWPPRTSPSPSSMGIQDLLEVGLFYTLTDKKQETLDVFQRAKRLQPGQPAESVLIYCASPRIAPASATCATPPGRNCRRRSLVLGNWAS